MPKQRYNRIPQSTRKVGKRGTYGLTVSVDTMWAAANDVRPGTALECYPHPRKPNVFCYEAPKTKNKK